MSKSKHTKHMIRRIPKNMTKDEIKNQYKAYKKKTSSLYKIGTKVVIIEVQHEYENGYLGIEGVIAQIKGKRLRVEYNSLGIAKDTIAIFEKIYFQDAIDDRYFADKVKNLGYFSCNGELVQGDDKAFINREKYEAHEIKEMDKILSKNKEEVRIKTENLLKLFGDE